MNSLPNPAIPAGVDIERDYRRRVFLDAGRTSDAYLVRHLVAEWHEDETKRLIDREDRPAVGRVRHIMLVGPNGLGLGRVSRVPVPQECTGLDIESTNDTGLLCHRIVIIDRTTDDDPAGNNDRW